MHQILLVVQILVAVGLIGLVLIQHGKGADAGAAFGGGGAGSVFGSQGPASLFTRLTAVFALVFFVNSIALAYIAKERSVEARSVMEGRTSMTEGGDLPINSDDLPTVLTPASDSDVPAQPSTGTEDSDLPASGADSEPKN